MNRTDQAPEPTMEEILASIRLIIADDAKKGGGGRLAPPRSEAAALDALPGEDVLNLTDAFVFPEDQPPPSAVDERHAMPPVISHEATAEAQQQNASAEEPEDAQAADMPPPEEAQASAESRPDLSRLTPPASRPIWSRRELPGAPPPAPASAPRYETPARPQQRNWAEDIQMPIPDRGPVSLIPGHAQNQVQEPAQEHQNPGRTEPEAEGELPNSLGETEEAAVAAIAESLARSAAGAMDSDELATAGDVDFSKLGEEQKAEVTETFANAIQRENTPHDKSPLPTLLDEVLRQDFIREPSRNAEPAEATSEPEPPSAAEGRDKRASEESFGSHWGAPGMALRGAPRPQPARQTGAESFSRPPETLAAPDKAPVKPASAREAHTARRASSGSPLEDAVRDMLRPLLVQWLNEHMPRVLESAIREEITTRGILPKTEK